MRLRATWLSLLLAVSALAADDPARQLLARCLERHAAARGLQCRVVCAFLCNVGSERRVETLHLRLAVELPNRFAFVPDDRTKLPETVCDGVRLWQTLPGRNEYVEAPAPHSLDEVALDVRDLGRVSPLLSALALRLLTQDGRTALAGEAAEVKDAGEETADGRACRVLRLSYPSRGAVLALWVDREGLLARRLQLDLSASAARNYGRPIQETRVVVSEDLRDIAVDAPLTEADFAFRPMPAWRCVDELNLDGRTPLPPDAQTLVGKAAPVVALTDGAGVVIHAPSGDGRPALLLFWRESEACGLALDTVNALSRAYAARGVGFYAVHVGNGNAAAAGRITEAVRRRGSHAPVFLDARGMAAASYQVRDLPVVAVVDRQGVLRRLLYANVLGLRRELRRELDAVANPVSLTEKPQDR